MEFSQVRDHVAHFPSSHYLDEVAEVMEELAGITAWDGREGPRAHFKISAGSVAIARKDPAKAERAAERQLRAHAMTVEALAAYVAEHGELPPEPPSRREITHWSRKSRNNMTRALCEIDYTGMLGTGRTPAMVTLTYPGEWLSVAPNGRACKEHLEEFGARYRRAWGTDLQAVWKLEFQRRGAPHFHLLMVPPHGTAHSRSDAAGTGLPFRQWLSVVWADIVNHQDPIEYANHLAAGTGVDFAEGMRARTPKHVAVYFTKHGTFRSKEYQHVVPDQWQGPGDGPGRFWGYWGLRRIVYTVEVSPMDSAMLARAIRRWARAQGTTHEVRVPRAHGGRALPRYPDVIGLAGAQLVAAQQPVRYRRLRRRVDRLRRGAGWVSVANGGAFTMQLARWLYRLKETAAAAVRPLVAGWTDDG